MVNISLSWFPPGANDGSILAVLKTNDKQYMTYKFNRQGKQLAKKQITGYVDSYYFGTLATLAHQTRTASGQFQLTVSTYDSTRELPPPTEVAASWKQPGLAQSGVQP